jgi:hypothetical protein
MHHEIAAFRSADKLPAVVDTLIAAVSGRGVGRPAAKAGPVGKARMAA